MCFLNTIKFQFVIGILLAVVYSCNSTQNNIPEIKADSLKNTGTIDTLSDQFLNVSDTASDSNFHREIFSIRENYKRINSIQKWTSVVTRDLEGESTEGGEARYFYVNGSLQKITARHFGEIFQATAEYYLLENQLSFVYEKTFKYNRPITYDSAQMKANGDTEVFDINKSEIIEKRSYFKDGKLVYGIDNREHLPLSKGELQQEEKTLKEAFESLMKSVKF